MPFIQSMILLLLLIYGSTILRQSQSTSNQSDHKVNVSCVDDILVNSHGIVWEYYLSPGSDGVVSVETRIPQYHVLASLSNHDEKLLL